MYARRSPIFGLAGLWFVYVDDGGFLTCSFADYAVPTASMIPELEILHMESPSPVTPLGAKGVAEGNAMSTPVCIANAVADALGVAADLPVSVSCFCARGKRLEPLRRDFLSSGRRTSCLSKFP
jgi:2-furoyl-CoA dehydrogenase large subunit